MELACAFCIAVRSSAPQPAVTVMNGQAVCHDHAYYVQGGEHGRILAIIRLDEEKKHEACSVIFEQGPKSRSLSEKVRKRLRG